MNNTIRKAALALLVFTMLFVGGWQANRHFDRTSHDGWKWQVKQDEPEFRTHSSSRSETVPHAPREYIRINIKTNTQ